MVHNYSSKRPQLWGPSTSIKVWSMPRTLSSTKESRDFSTQLMIKLFIKDALSKRAGVSGVLRKTKL